MIVAGENWDAANVEAVKAAQEETTFLVHPFDQVGQLLTWLDNFLCSVIGVTVTGITKSLTRSM